MTNGQGWVLSGGIAAAVVVAIGILAIDESKKNATPAEETAVEQKDILTALAEQAQESIADYEAVAPHCTPEFAAAVQTLMPANYVVESEFKGTFCQFTSHDTTLPVNDALYDVPTYTVYLHPSDTTEGYGDEQRTLAAEELQQNVADDLRAEAAPHIFCDYFNETVVPVLTAARISAPLYGDKDDDADCVVFQDTSDAVDFQGNNARWEDELLVVFSDHNFENGNLTYPEERAKSMLDELPIEDRRAIDQNLAALLAPPAPAAP